MKKGFIFIFLIILTLGVVAHPQKTANAAAIPTGFMVLPFNRGAVQVQQGWISHFDTIDPQTGKCRLYGAPVNGKCVHGGVDYIYVKSGYWVGFDVAAAEQGSMTCYNSAITKSYKAFGVYCTIKHTYNNQIYYTLYAHLASTEVSISSSTGKSATIPVMRGQKIGVAGDTGSASAPGTDPNKRIHLHFELRKGTDWTNGVKVDPYGLKTTQNQPSHTKYPSATSNKILSPVSTFYWFNNPPRIYSQSFFDPNQNYEIKSSSGLCLDLTNGNTENGNKIQLWNDCVQNNNQKWKIASVSTIASVFVIQNLQLNSSNLNPCVDITNGNTSLPVQVWGCEQNTANTNQQWRPEINSDGTFLIKNPAFGCLAPISQQNQSQVVIKSCNVSDTSQRWKITKVP